MHISAIGELRPDLHIPEWLVSESIPIPFLDGLPLTFTLKSLEEQDANDATTAIESFLRLGPGVRLAASPHVYKNYLHIAEILEDEDIGCEINSPTEVWDYVQPTGIYVSRRARRDKAIYITMSAECDWEPEHGLQLVFRQGAILSRVSDQDGHVTHTDAFDLPEDQDKIS